MQAMLNSSFYRKICVFWEPGKYVRTLGLLYSERAPHNTALNGRTTLGFFVFLLTDTRSFIYFYWTFQELIVKNQSSSSIFYLNVVFEKWVILVDQF